MLVSLPSLSNIFGNNMARQIRKKSGTGIYHVMLRGINRQDRFRSEPVDNIEYFVILLRYIHQNPLKAGIVERIEDYPWSSWKEYEQILDIETDGIKSVSDSDVKAFLLKKQGFAILLSDHGAGSRGRFC